MKIIELQIWTPLPIGAIMHCCVNKLAQRKPILSSSADLFPSPWRQQFAAFCLFVRTLPIDFALLTRKRKYIKIKTTAKLKAKRTSIATIWYLCWTYATFPTPPGSHYRLPLNSVLFMFSWFIISFMAHAAQSLHGDCWYIFAWMFLFVFVSASTKSWDGFAQNYFLNDFLMQLWSFESVPEISLPSCISFHHVQ